MEKGWPTRSVCLGQSDGDFQTLPRAQPQSLVLPGSAQILLSASHILPQNPSACLLAYFQWIQTQRVLSPSSPVAAAPPPLSMSPSHLLHPPDPLLVPQEKLSLTFTVPYYTVSSN